MGSYSSSLNQNIATDNRAAATDQAISLSASGNSKSTLRGDILDTNVSGSNNNVSFLDGGAIDRAFEFSQNALSSVLDSLITGGKTNSPPSTLDSIVGDGVKDAALDNDSGEIDGVNADNNNTKFIVGGVLLLGGYYFFKGKK